MRDEAVIGALERVAQERWFAHPREVAEYVYDAVVEAGMRPVNTRTKEGLREALILLDGAKRKGLPSCSEAARKAMVNMDQHAHGCRLDFAIGRLKEFLG